MSTNNFIAVALILNNFDNIQTPKYDKDICKAARVQYFTIVVFVFDSLLKTIFLLTKKLNNDDKIRAITVDKNIFVDKLKLLNNNISKVKNPKSIIDDKKETEQNLNINK